MSTQIRENRWQRTGCTESAGQSGKVFPGPIARCECVQASGGTAPPETPVIYPGDEALSPVTPVYPPQRRSPVAGDSGMVGHKLSANGLPSRKACSACSDRSDCLASSSGQAPRLAASRGWRSRGNRHTSELRHIPPAHPLPFRPRAAPSIFAAGPSRQTPLGGKVRWQKRFASPARRMKHGLQSLKTINSRRSTTNAKTSTPWPAPSRTAASPAFSPACSPLLWTWAWSATPSFM